MLSANQKKFVKISQKTLYEVVFTEKFVKLSNVVCYEVDLT